MNGAKLFSTATVLTLLALLGFMLAGFSPIIVDVAFGIEALAVFIALTGLVAVAFVTVRTSMERAARHH